MTDQTTKAEALAALRTWQAHIDGIKSLEAGIKAAVGSDPGSTLRTGWGPIMDAYTQKIAQQVGDKSERLEWYAHENDMGRHGIKASNGGESRPIRTLDDLIWLIG